jgi:hypothetical protein
MRYAGSLALCLAVPGVLLAADILLSLGLDQAEFEEACFQFVKEPERLPHLRITPAMRAMAVLQRKSAVEALGAKAKAYYASEAFKRRWAEHRSQFTGGEDREQQRAAAEAQVHGQVDAALQQMEQMMPMLPPAQQAEVRKALAKAKAEKAEKARKAKTGDGDSDAPPKDPNVQLKKALKHFLAVTDGVDYGAGVSLQNGRKYFSNKDFEAKPAEWKLAYRAGREASEGARGYVRAWLAVLK